MPWYYFGVHTDNGKPYFGSPKTHKWLWNFYGHKVTILEWFETRGEANSVETRIISHFINDSNCLNECVGGKFSLESLRRGARTRNQLPVKESTKQKLRDRNKIRWQGTPESRRKEIAKKIQLSKGTPIQILETFSGEIKKFPSLKEARKHYHIGMTTIRKMFSGIIPEFKGLKVIHAGIV
jgi:hypothetical protein